MKVIHTKAGVLNRLGAVHSQKDTRVRLIYDTSFLVLLGMPRTLSRTSGSPQTSVYEPLDP